MRVTGDDVRRVRRAAKMTQRQFAAYMGVTRRTVIRWEQSSAFWFSYGILSDRFDELENPRLPFGGDTNQADVTPQEVTSVDR